MTGRLFVHVGFDFTLSALFFHSQDWPAASLLVLSVDDSLTHVPCVQELKLARASMESA